MPASMTTYRCPHCGHTMEFDEISNDQTVTCSAPLCGKEFQVKLPEAEPEPELIVPGEKNVQSDKTDSAIEEETPEERESAFASDDKDDRVIATIEAPMFRRHPVRFAAYSALVLLGLAGMAAAILQASVGLGVLSLLPLAVGLCLLAFWWRRAKRSTLTITKTSLVLSDALVEGRTQEIHHRNIKEIHIFQPPLCRLLNSGALLIEWGNESDERVYLESVSDPQAVVKQIRELAKK